MILPRVIFRQISSLLTTVNEQYNRSIRILERRYFFTKQSSLTFCEIGRIFYNFIAFDFRKCHNISMTSRAPIVDGILRSEFPHVPVQTETFSKTFLSTIWRHFIKDPHRPAMINGHDEMDYVTFGELYMYSYAMSAFLERTGFALRDVACIVTPNCWQYMVAFGSVIMRGGALSGASNAFTSFELQNQFDDCKCTIVFTSECCLDRVLEATKSNVNIKTIVLIDSSHGQTNTSTSDDRIVLFTDILRNEPSLNCASSIMSDENFCADKHVIILPYSSGTTGRPKGVMISHKNLGSVLNMYSWQFNNKILPFVDDHYDYSKEIQLDLLPFYHIFGFVVVVNHLMNGSTVVVMRGFEPKLLCHNLETYKSRFLMVVPPIMIFLAKSPLVSRYNLSYLQLIISGAAPAGRELCEELQRRLPNLKAVAQGYGMTELSICSHIPVLDGKNRYDRAGKLMPNMELKIIDTETGKIITDQRKPGELYLRGPNVMMGYLDRPDANAETLDSDGWLRTGDIAFVDAEGFICIVDRLKELIKVRGFQVAPAELEDVILSMTEVRDCAVIGVPDKQAGELPAAFVVRAQAFPDLSAEDVFNYVKDRAAHYKQLKGGVYFVDEIPKSPSGKILRRVLRQSYLYDQKRI